MMAAADPVSHKRLFLVSYPRSGSTLLRKYFSLLQGQPQGSVYQADVVNESSAPLAQGLERIELVKSHQLPDGDSDIVYLVRDGRNATLSFLYMKFLMGNHRFSARREILDALRYVDAEEGSWASHVRNASAQCARRRILFAKYEDLVTRPEWFLQRVLEFAQAAPPSSAVLSECVRLERKSDSYERNPYNGYSFQPEPNSIYETIKRHRFEDYWRFVFDADCRRHFHEQGGTEFLLRFGYESSADWWQ